ncbi:MAD2 mitotic arrest deficient-like 2 [Balamuthia mandrillaris]
MDVVEESLLPSRGDFIDFLVEFLEVAVHQILYQRNVYPRESFARRTKYDTPVHMSRVPIVCDYVAEILENLRGAMSENLVDKVRIMIYDERNLPQECYVFELDLPIGATSSKTGGGEALDDTSATNADWAIQLSKELQGFLLKMNVAEAYLRPLNQNHKQATTFASWSFIVETKEKIPGGDVWIRTEAGKAAMETDAVIIPLKSLQTNLHSARFQLYVEDITAASSNGGGAHR